MTSAGTVKILAVAAAVLVWAGLPAVAFAQHTGAVDEKTILDRIKQANGLYETGEYQRALEIYQGVLGEGVSDPDVYYNLGNACYKVGNLGFAVLYYERALRLAPRDEDTRSNLALVKSLLRDKQFLSQSGVVKKALTWPRRNLNVQEAFVVSSLLYLVLTVIIIGLIFRDTRFVSKSYSRISIASPGRFFGLDKTQDFILAAVTVFVLVAASGTSAVEKYRTTSERKEAVVIVEEAAVYGNPTEDSTLQFKIHEGTKVIAQDQRLGWVQIRLPGDLYGWVRDNSVESI